MLSPSHRSQIASIVAILFVALLFWAAYPRTQYAPGFSEAKFRKVTVGMSAKRLTELLGKPITSTGKILEGGPVLYISNEKHPPAQLQPLPTRFEVRKYSVDEIGSPLDKGYFARTVCLSNGVVVSVEKSLVWGKSVWNGF